MKITDVLKEGKLLDVKTYTPEHLAKLHKVPLSHIEKQLKMGIEVEQEHTHHKDIAREIALDHIKEDPNYYTKLKKVENKD